MHILQLPKPPNKGIERQSAPLSKNRAHTDTKLRRPPNPGRRRLLIAYPVRARRRPACAPPALPRALGVGERVLCAYLGVPPGTRLALSRTNTQ